MNLVGALDHCREHLVQFGGHELAAGLSVMRCNIDAFRKMINDYARESLSEDVFVMKCEADCEIKPDEMSMDIVDQIALLEPFGVANQTPLFLVRGMTLERIISMGAGKHSKLMLSHSGKSFTAVCFGMPSSALDFNFGESVDLLCQLAINEFRGQKSLQLIVQDIRLSEELEKKYEGDSKRFSEIMSGGAFCSDEDVIPSRADVAHVYKFLRYEEMCGHTMYSYRDLHCAMIEQLNVEISCLKLKFIIKILADMKVCEFEEFGEEIFAFEVLKNAQKSSIDQTETYKMLSSLCRA